MKEINPLKISKEYKKGYKEGYNDAVHMTNVNNLENGTNDYKDGYHHGFEDGEYSIEDLHFYLEAETYN